MSIVYQMTKEFPWLNYCVHICTISDVPELYDISHVFDREAQRLQEEKNGPAPEKEEVEEEDPETARFFAPPEADEDEDDDDKMVYVNGRLIKKSELKERNFQEHQN